jgi:hypothetical protein
MTWVVDSKGVGFIEADMAIVPDAQYLQINTAGGYDF